MKKIYLILTLCISNNAFSVIDFKPVINEEYYLGNRNIVTPAFQNPIHSSDLSSSASPQYSIKTSGRYYLSSDLSQTANGASDVVLQINASNVILDLNSKAIIPHVSGSLATGTGIALVKGYSNIIIMNGAITGIDSSSTQKLNTGIDLSNSGSGTSYAIRLYDVYITKCKLSGIIGTDINDLSIENCAVNDCKNTDTANISAVELTTINNLMINNCEFNNNDADDGYCESLRLVDCIDGKVENVVASNNQATNYVSGIALDYSSTGCQNLLFNNINTSNNISSAGMAIGFCITDSPLNTITNSTANNNTSASVDGACGIALFDTSANSDNCKLINICASKNNSAANTAYGVYIESNNNYLKNISACKNSTAANASTSGIYLSGANSNTLLECTTDNNQNTNTSTSTLANAFGLAVIGDNNYCFKCNAAGNQTSANAAIKAVGFYVSQGTNNKFEECIASANNASHATASVMAAGFELNSTETRTQLVRCEANNNLAGDGTTSAAGARAYGVYLQGTTGADQCIIQNCTVQNNSISSSGKAFGFYDNDTASTSIFIGNLAIGQGKCLSSTLDASLQWNGNSEPAASQNFFFKHAGIGDNPTFTIQEVPRENFTSLSTAVLKWQNISIY